MLNLVEIAKAGVISDAPTLQRAGISILNFVLSIAGTIAIIALVVSGIKYFLSFDDERKMETAKNSAKYAVLGIVIIMGALVLIRVVEKFLDSSA